VQQDVPEDLRDVTTFVEWPLPTKEELKATLTELLSGQEKRGRQIELKGSVDELVDAAAGLSLWDAQGAFGYSMMSRRCLDPHAIAETKKAAIDQVRGLTWWEPEPRGMAAVGGLYRLKLWVARQRVALSPAAREYGLPPATGVLLLGVPGCQPAGSRVLAGDGQWTTIEQLRVGDRVLSPQRDGSVTVETVQRLVSYDSDVYRVSTRSTRSAARSYRAAADHTMPVLAPVHRGGRRVFELVELTVEEFSRRPAWWRGKAKLFTCPAVDLPRQSLPVDPYALGLVLGDGCLRGHAARFVNPHAALFDALEGSGLELGRRTWRNGAWHASFRAGSSNRLRSLLGATLSIEKAVPASYLEAGLDQRLSLLAGLIDTDGSAREFTSSSETLARQFVHLVCSVGGAATVRHRTTRYQKGGTSFDSWRVSFSFAEHRPPVLLEDKRQAPRNLGWKNPRHHGFAVAPDGRERVYGITLSGESHWYVTDDWLVTRNCGKSLVAKVVPTAFDWPLVRMDLGEIRGKYVGECFAADTEFLTEAGMKHFDEIGKGERLATFNIATGALEYQLPSARHDYAFDGEMLSVPGRGLLVTPNHRMVARRPGRPDWYFAEASEAFEISNVSIPVAPATVDEVAPDTLTVPGVAVRHGRGKAVTLPTVEMLELLGYFVADGSTNNVGGRGTVRITQQDGPLAQRMLYLLGKFGPAKAHGSDNRSDPPVRQLHVQSIPLWSYLREHCGTGHANKRLPEWVLRASRSQLRILWDALMATDGSRDGRGFPSESYSTTSPFLAEQVQEIAFRMGLRVTCRTEKPAAPHKPLYVVSVTPRDTFAVGDRFEWIEYQGRVVCFTVPNGTLVTRRDGKWSITGNSEGNFARARRVVETVAPCVLWLDELEKALGGGSDGMVEGGVGQRLLGSVLIWLQEKKAEVFVVATCNNAEALPPELIRKGRFGEIFFVGLPTEPERRAILATTLRKFGRDPEGAAFDLARVADASRRFSGAEVAELVPAGLLTALVEEALGAGGAGGDEQDVTVLIDRLSGLTEDEIAAATATAQLSTEHLLAAARETRPLSKTAAEKLDRLHRWARGRAVPASYGVDEEQLTAEEDHLVQARLLDGV
jgi:hypothetical protein